MASPRAAKRTRLAEPDRSDAAEARERGSEAGRDDDDEEPPACAVRPMGNLAMDGAAAAVDRAAGLGSLRALDDLTLLRVLANLTPEELCPVLATSKALYVLGTWDSLYRPHALRRLGGGFRFGRDWRDTYARGTRPGRRRVGARLDLRERYYSDALYREWLLANWDTDDPLLTDPVPAACAVDRRSGLTPEAFRAEYELVSKPVVIMDVVPRWPAFRSWTRESLLRRFGYDRFKVSGREMPLAEFFEYSRRNRDQRPLYLFDSDFVKRCPEMESEYTLPDYFADDFFRLLGGGGGDGDGDGESDAAARRRPDHRWLIIGPARSGSSFHVDPNGTCAFNAVITGRKKWILYPPGSMPPTVHPDAHGGFSTDTALGAWLLDHAAAVAEMPPEERPIECVCSAGEIMFVPSGWWHCVINLDESIALTHNVVTEANLVHAIDLLAEPASCPPGRCGGDVMGDVPLWVALGGSTTPAPSDAAVAAAGCSCDRVKAALLARLRAGLERERPGLEQRLRERRDRDADESKTLWDRLTEDGAAEGGFSFGFS